MRGYMKQPEEYVYTGWAQTIVKQSDMTIHQNIKTLSYSCRRFEPKRAQQLQQLLPGTDTAVKEGDVTCGLTKPVQRTSAKTISQGVQSQSDSSWRQALWDSRPAIFFFSNIFSDKRMDGSATYNYCWPSQIRVPRHSWPYFTVSDARLPQPGGLGPGIYTPKNDYSKWRRSFVLTLCSHLMGSSNAYLQITRAIRSTTHQGNDKGWIDNSLSRTPPHFPELNLCAHGANYLYRPMNLNKNLVLKVTYKDSLTEDLGWSLITRFRKLWVMSPSPQGIAT
jgi:hypothetical protein